MEAAYDVILLRYAEADRIAKEKDASLMKMRESSSDRERHLQAEVQTMASKLEDSAVRLRQLEWNVKDLEKEKAAIAERLMEFIISIFH